MTARIEFARCLRPERSRRDLRARRPSGRTASAIWSRKRSCWRSPSLVFVGGACSANMLFNLLVGRAPASGRALLREVRASFYRKLFLAFVAAAIVPVLALALVSRAYMANLMLADIESEATRLATVASRVFEDLRAFVGQSAVADDLIVWLSRVIAQDVNIFDGPSLLASSERNLFASGLLPTRTPGEVYRAIFLDGRPSFVGRERAGGLEYLIAATPVQLEGREAMLTVPLASRQQETAGADRGARSPRAAGRGAVHHARRRHRLLHGRAHRRSGQSPDARDAAHRARRSRRARAGHVVRRTAAAGRCLQPDGRRPAAPARRARAHQPARGVGRHGAAGGARHQEPADADPAECRAPAARAPRSGQAARRRARRVRRATSSARCGCCGRSRRSSRASPRRPSRVRSTTDLGELVDEVVEPYRAGLAGRVDDRDARAADAAAASASIAC